MRITWIHVIMVFITGALGGLVWVQTTLLKEGYEARERLFDREVYGALNRIASALENEASMALLDDQLQDVALPDMNQSFTITETPTGVEAEVVMGDTALTFTAADRTALDSVLRAEGMHPEQYFRRGMDVYLRQLIDEFYVQTMPLEERIDSGFVHQLVRHEVARTGITAPYQFALVDPFQMTALYSNVSRVTSTMVRTGYRLPVFADDVYQDQLLLILQFPQKRRVIVRSNWRLLLSSMIFIVIILLCFGAAVAIIFRQRRLSQLKNDFINNMTHELKTPVATIGLATEMLQKDRVQQDPDKLRNYTGIIRMENQRLGSHIERVLQAATLEREQLKLKTEPADLNDLVRQTVSKFQLRLDDIGAEVRWSLHPDRLPVQVDRMMISNAISNIVDNAMKYRRPDEPLVLLLETARDGRNARLSIRDNGIGMSEGNLQKVFTRFYRVPTGNLHDVKGFGLGLSYVQTIIDEHDGQVFAESQPGEFSKFTILIPLKKTS